MIKTTLNWYKLNLTDTNYTQLIQTTLTDTMQSTLN